MRADTAQDVTGRIKAALSEWCTKTLNILLTTIVIAALPVIGILTAETLLQSNVSWQ